MARRDDLHFPVRKALEKEGWRITYDPAVLFFRNLRMQADIGAEKIFASEKGKQKIVVEVKDFDIPLLVSELQRMMGQLDLYQWALEEHSSDYKLYLAVSKEAYDGHIQVKDSAFHAIVERKRINLIVFDTRQEVILQWITQ